MVLTIAAKLAPDGPNSFLAFYAMAYSKATSAIFWIATMTPTLKEGVVKANQYLETHRNSRYDRDICEDAELYFYYTLNHCAGLLL